MSGWSVTLDELDALGVVRGLADREAVELSRTGLVEVRPEGGGLWRLLPRGYVGAVRVADMQVQVKPKEKVGIAALLFLLGYAKDPGFRADDVDGIDQEDLWPALAWSVARQCERALQHGILQGYERVDEASATVRGRIRLGDQISRRPGLLMPLEVSYDEFTVNTPENQILRTALRRMLAVPRLDPKVRRRLLHLDVRLVGASVLPRSARLPRWVPSRLNARYQPALRLSEVVLRHASAEAGNGGLEVASFVVPMWRVFENFLTTALTEALALSPGRTVAQFRDYLDEPAPGKIRGVVPMDVDIVHLDVREQPQVVFDAKYKVTRGDGRYPNADHYQMLAYCTALQVPMAWLVYAQGGDLAVRRRIRHTGVTVVEYPLDLTRDPRHLLGQVAELARAGVSPVVATA